ncbi:Peptidase M4, thermolysin propeptide [Azotobacter vinelandii CA]|uniref:Peptidase M4, thermolysin propeptide n=2 Tax=Azotobacter vinelandii TaxID=354 RepID=C1DLU4_AZOVD|nr:PepSY domain-containing protein [Azotobacter vinelandii]ACO79031.1 Peptidase M4, thermolysin propeptide [Azotobacter vinelandii DJ]AGK16533.1 Peptidase M4, thermolysin propeptide [Azotobacter vinelandii CA]AGK20909.1 Peptidase M4, thermolysin propeptide [Azotobacter vinelandii CA6]WKN20016.1 PepSY domain-containing protein [Azotobacter vinelandii]SFX52310.1 Peptidase propeptide and YPEB domain-containing protein [Azotobacter vinelandii]
MMRACARFGAWGAALLAAFCLLSADARDLDQDQALRLRQEGVILPLEQLVRSALDRYPGASLLEAELEEEHGAYVYEVELLTTGGVVRELELDARDGRILKDEEDD